MTLHKGIPLLYQQFTALFKKNFLLSWRSKRATALQLFSSLFFIFLIFIIQEARKAQTDASTAYRVLRDPEPLVAPPIPPCEDKFYIKLPCFDFVWSGNDSQKIGRIARAIMENNPGRPIPDSKVKSFKTADEVDEWLFNNQQRVPGALHFSEKNSTVISYGLQTNSTPVAIRGQYEDPTFKFQIPLQIAAEREIARSLIGGPNFSWFVGFKEFAHPAIESLSIFAILAPTFFLAITTFNFVFQTGLLVSEKELKLRQVGFAFIFAPFIGKSSSATTVGFFVFIVGFVTQIVTTFGFPYDDSIDHTLRNVWSLFPPNLLAQGISILSGATSTPEDVGVRWSRRAKCAPNDDGCVITMDDIYKWLAGTFFLWVVLAVYLDNVLPDVSGVRKSLFYFLKPSYWTGKGGNVKEGGLCSCISSTPAIEDITPDDDDVLAEENIVKQQTREGAVDPNVAVQIRGLAKTYPGSRTIGCCCKFKKTSPYHAVKGLWVNLEKDQLFCLLGPNGAGKTTAINCMTGVVPVTGGDALIYGYSVRSFVGMSNIRRLIGVCPQFDILWDTLSGQEHLQLFANIKGLPPASIKLVVNKSLAEVKLTEAAKVRAGSYSGGMKRRLSVAAALIGDPKLVILDEPTTGMDPITRRHVWDIIETAKKGRAIVLTTHSMEEADILSDRIGIMAKGRLRCIGTSIRLKSRFGTGFITNISFSGNNNAISPFNGDEVNTTHHHESVKQFFKHHLDVEPKEENKAFLTFVIPHDREKLLTKFFSELEGREKEFGIADIQLGLTTLEEVFLSIARQAELESAAAEQRLVTLTLTSGDSLEIPVGARFVGIPGTESTTENSRGLMVEVYWEQDDTGTLCISGHSSEMLIPLDAQVIDSVAASNRNPSGRRGTVHGIVINPNPINSQ